MLTIEMVRDLFWVEMESDGPGRRAVLDDCGLLISAAAADDCRHLGGLQTVTPAAAIMAATCRVMLVIGARAAAKAWVEGELESERGPSSSECTFHQNGGTGRGDRCGCER